jgi:hypothetical protein
LARQLAAAPPVAARMAIGDDEDEGVNAWLEKRAPQCVGR